MDAGTATLTWVKGPSCEGGPLLVTELTNVADWFGATPFTELQKRFPGDARFEASRTVLHYFGQFSGELPDPFTLPEGGHGYLDLATEDAARAKLEEFCATVVEVKPGTSVRKHEEAARFVTPQGQHMSAELTSRQGSSQYDDAWQSGQEGEYLNLAWVHSVGRGDGLFWDLHGHGTPDVGISPTRDEIVFVDGFLNWHSNTEQAEVAAMHALVDAPTPDEETVGEIAFTTENLIVIWSPMSIDDIEPSVDQITADLADRDTLDVPGGGFRAGPTAVRLQPGRYRISVGDNENDDRDEEWSCLWCRLVKVG